MWFPGLLLGAALGSLAGFYGALAGGLLGLVLGLQWKRERMNRGDADAPLSSAEQRLRTLEAQVDWLYRDAQALRAEVARLRGDPVEATGEAAADESLVVAAAPAEQDVIAPPAAAAESPLGDTSRDDAPAPDSPPEMPAAPTWWSRLLAGNLLAKVGVILLFFGVASGLRLAAEYGLLPVQLRLLLGAVAGLAMILFGWSRAQQAERRMFGLALQGGGFAILYLIVYFMLARYALLGEAASFTLFALLGVVCVLLAARQEGEQLAVFGMAGTFLAPVLAASGGGDPAMLFGYFALLNVFVLGVGWFRSWRALNVAGFILTLVVGMSWAIDQYRPLHYPVTQAFLILFCVMYSAASPLTALLRAPGWKGWGEGILVFGTPLAGSFLQAALLGDDPTGWRGARCLPASITSRCGCRSIGARSRKSVCSNAAISGLRLPC